MKFTVTNIKGVFIIEPDRLEDNRGFFARVWCQEEFKTNGLSPKLSQCNISFNNKKGTLRGMHFQENPHAEIKAVRCTMGSFYDVCLDLRKDSKTFMEWFSVELTAENRKILYIPEGLAHGYQTLLDNTEAFYQVSEFHHPECARGVRWNDPAFNIKWPLTVSEISQKDSAWPDWKL